ncbi:MAG: efflux RND transporter periplasmic adaptor subunit [Alphaproteobacteria bacterium]|nr:efflux RND transporter periplasmic adaptor subunit [Alphaproteobacteria bacterium]
MKNMVIIAAAAAALGLGGGYFLFGGQSEMAKTSAEKKPLYWVAPMDPSYRRDGPGKSPMGMDLVPVYEETSGGAKGYAGAEINPRIINNIGVQTEPARVESLTPQIKTVGQISFDEKATAHVHLRASGWVEKLHIRAEGERVEKGAALFDAYSPELIAAQGEYLQARTSGRQALIASARERLVGFGLTAETISLIEEKGKPLQSITVRAPISGTVTKLNISDAARLTPGKPAMQITNLQTMWLIADVFESDMGNVAVGAYVRAKSLTAGSHAYDSTVDHIYPDLNMVTRTNPVRAVLENSDGRLRPGMYMQVAIDRAAVEDALTVPRSAVIRLGNSDHVILAEGEGQFRPAEVKVGLEVDGRLQILEGIESGEKVVTAGQFMLDAESNFQGASIRIGGPATMSDDMAEEPEAVSGFTKGTINEVDQDARTINISHDAIEALGMMGMTMTFPLSDDLDMSELSEGQMIHFEVTKTPEGRFIVTTIHVMGGM